MRKQFWMCGVGLEKEKSSSRSMLCLSAPTLPDCPQSSVGEERNNSWALRYSGEEGWKARCCDQSCNLGQALMGRMCFDKHLSIQYISNTRWTPGPTWPHFLLRLLRLWGLKLISRLSVAVTTLSHSLPTNLCSVTILEIITLLLPNYYSAPPPAMPRKCQNVVFPLSTHSFHVCWNKTLSKNLGKVWKSWLNEILISTTNKKFWWAKSSQVTVSKRIGWCSWEEAQQWVNPCLKPRPLRGALDEGSDPAPGVASCWSSVSQVASVRKNYTDVEEAAGTCKKRRAAGLFMMWWMSDGEKNGQLCCLWIKKLRLLALSLRHGLEFSTTETQDCVSFPLDCSTALRYPPEEYVGTSLSH